MTTTTTTTATLDDKGVIAACPDCGQRNRTPWARLGETGGCGRCQAALPPPAVPLDVDTAARFDALVNGGLPVLVDFWAAWCGPCRAVAPEMEKVAATNAGRFVVAKVNTEALPDVAARFGIQSIPTMTVFVRGREVARTAGARPAAAIEAFVREAVSGAA